MTVVAEEEGNCKRLNRNKGSYWSIVSLSKWRWFVLQDLWDSETYAILWGSRIRDEMPPEVLQAAFEHGQTSGDFNPYQSSEAVFWLRGCCKRTESGTASPPSITYFDYRRKLRAKRRAIREARQVAYQEEQKRLTKIVNVIDGSPQKIDEFGYVWGEMMRFQPNGWHSVSTTAALVDQATGSGNWITKNQWSDDGTQNAQYVENIPKQFESTPPISEAATKLPVLPFHIAWKQLRLTDQAMLWTHYIPIADHDQKLRLLRTDTETYGRWLDVSLRRIDEEMCELPPPAPEPPEPVPIGPPLWSCRIFGSVHKCPVRHTAVSELPASFDSNGMKKLRPDPRCDSIVFRLPAGTVYARLTKQVLKKLKRRGEAAELLELAKNEATHDEQLNWRPEMNRPPPFYNCPEWITARKLDCYTERLIYWSNDLLTRRKDDRQTRNY